jgi:hypothetical protein
MTYFGCAVENVGKNVLIIKDNKVIGKGSSQIMRGDEWVGIRFTEGEVLELVKDFAGVKAIGLKHNYFKYLPNSGLFWAAAFDEDEEKAWEVLGQTMVIDEFNFSFGIAPDHFKQVEGFNHKMAEPTNE